jgi:hypothetical protein
MISTIPLLTYLAGGKTGASSAVGKRARLAKMRREVEQVVGGNIADPTSFQTLALSAKLQNTGLTLFIRVVNEIAAGLVTVLAAQMVVR